ncbi:MAG: hypothetical protein AAF597_21205 [Bacteroidota bacterium]
MPLMFKESVNPAPEVSLGDVSIQPDAYTSGTVKERSWEATDALVTLPAGAYAVSVRNIDPVPGSTITVNGESFGFNRYFERAVRIDEINKNQDFAPEVTINNPDGRKVAISVSYPSASPVNPDLL